MAFAILTTSVVPLRIKFPMKMLIQERVEGGVCFLEFAKPATWPIAASNTLHYSAHDD